MRKTGFTLAETLITLGIIGIISALTLPNIISNYKNKVFAAQLQKIYNQLSNIAVQAMSDEEIDNLSESTLSESAGVFLKKYFRITKDCGILTSTSTNGCFASSYKLLTNKNETGSGPENIECYAVVINTGTSICMQKMNPDEDNEHGYSEITVDVNGTAGPNVAGRDLFYLRLYSDGKVGDFYLPYVDADLTLRCTREDVASGIYGANCIDKIISDGWKMDY